MALSISVTGITGIDETSGLQEQDIAAFPSGVETVFNDALLNNGFAETIGGDAIQLAGDPTGSDVTITSGPVKSLSLTDVNGLPLMGAPTGLFTLNDEAITLTTDSVNDNVVLGIDAGGDVIFAIYLQEEIDATTGNVTGADFWIALFEPLKHPGTGDSNDVVDLTGKLYVAAQGELGFSFTGAPSGQNDFMAFGTSPGVAIIASGASPADTVNSGKGGNNPNDPDDKTALGTNSQDIGAQESLFFTFVNDMDPRYLVPGLTSTEASNDANILYGSLFGSTGAAFNVVKVTGGPASTTPDVTIRAFTTDAEQGTNFLSGIGDGDDHPVAVTSVSINGNDVTNDPTMVKNNLDGTFTIIGAVENDRIAYTTAANHTRLEIENSETGNVAFSVAGFSLISTTGTEAEAGSKLDFYDDGPLEGGTDITQTVYEDALAGGNPDNDGVTETTVATGDLSTLFVSGADAPGLQYTFNTAVTSITSQNGIVIGLTPGTSATGNETMTGSSGGVDLFIIELQTDGNFTFTLLNAFDQSAQTNGNPDNDLDEVAIGNLFKTSDQDGDSLVFGATAVRISVEDDAPVFKLVSGAGVLQTDDAELSGGPDTAMLGIGSLYDYDPLVAPNAGADGDGGTVFTLELSATSVTTSLVDSGTKEAVVLAMNNGAVEGRTVGTNDLVFTLTIDSVTGMVTQTQHRAVEHATPDTSGYATDIIGLGTTSGSILVRGTLSDGEATPDTATDTVDITTKVTFSDDGPTFTITDTGAAIQTDDGGLATGNSGGSASATVLASSLFTIGGAGGADGDGGVAYSLELGGNTLTNLVDTATGSQVALSLNSGVIEGRTNDANGFLVFTLSVNAAGDVTMVQSRAVQHSSGDTSGYPSDTTGLGVMDAVWLRGTRSDGETAADTATDRIDLSDNISFTDDGPVLALSAGAGLLTTDDAQADATTPDTATLGIGSLYTVDSSLPGADGGGGTVWTLQLTSMSITSSLVDVATGDFVVLTRNGTTGDIEGKNSAGDLVFSLSIDAAGNVTQSQYRAVQHSVSQTSNFPSDVIGISLPAGQAINVQGTLSDGEGVNADTTTATVDITGNLRFTDDGPAFTMTDLGGVLQTDDGGLTGGNEGGSLTDTKGDGALFSASAQAGADGSGGVVYTLELGAVADSGLVDALTGQPVTLSMNGAAVEGKNADGNVVFTLTVDSSNGDVTLTQARALSHGSTDTASPYDGDVVTMLAADAVYLKGTLSDGEGAGADTASDRIDLAGNIAFTDDGPAVDVQDSSGNYLAGAQGVWTDLSGADGFQSFDVSLTGYSINGVSGSLANATFTKGADDFTYSGTINDDFNADGVADVVGFTLTFNQAGDSYDLQLTTPPSTTVTRSTADGSLDAGGPDPVRTLTLPNGDEIVFSAVDPTVSGSGNLILNASEAVIEATAGYLSPDEMNVSTAGIGNDNNNFDGNALSGVDGTTTKGGKTDESFVIDPTNFDVAAMKIYIDNSVGGYDNPPEELYYRIYYSDSTTDSGLIPVTTPLTPEAGGQVSFIIGDQFGANNIDAVQLFMGAGTIKIPVIEFIETQAFAPLPTQLNLSAVLTDNDGDTSTDGFMIDLVDAPMG